MHLDANDFDRLFRRTEKSCQISARVVETAGARRVEEGDSRKGKIGEREGERKTNLVPASKSTTNRRRGDAVHRVELLTRRDALRVADGLLDETSETHTASRERERGSVRSYEQERKKGRKEEGGERGKDEPRSPVGHLTNCDGVDSLVDTADTVLAPHVTEELPPARATSGRREGRRVSFADGQ